MSAWRFDSPWLPRIAVFFAAYAALVYTLLFWLSVSDSKGLESSEFLTMLGTSGQAANFSGMLLGLIGVIAGPKQRRRSAIALAANLLVLLLLLIVLDIFMWTA